MKSWRIVLATSLIGAAALAIAIPAALAEPPSTPPRADAYYVVMCLAPGDTTPTAFERVDAHAVEVGNKGRPGRTLRRSPRGLAVLGGTRPVRS